jgi:diguanylate cyclase (GGDEF)-like protein/PAS domain S-box-containing protein
MRLRGTSKAGESASGRSKSARDAEILGHTARIRIAEPELQWERISCILDLSFDYYWELDRELRVTEIWHTNPAERRRVRALLLGRTRWEVGGNPVGDTWANHREILESRRQFENLVVHWTNESGDAYFLRYAGRPRFGDDGQFLGYMGITQDVTEEIFRDRLEALELSVTKYLIHGDVSARSLSLVLQSFCETLGWQLGRFWKPTAGGEKLQLLASTSRKEAQAIDKQAGGRPLIAPDDAPVSRTWASLTPSGESPPRENPFVVDARDPRRILIPLANRRQRFGVLEFASREPGRIRGDWRASIVRIVDYICTALDKDRTLHLLRQSEERFASTVELAAIGICHVDLAGRLLHVNGQMTKMLGYTREELLGKNVLEISHPDDAEVSDAVREQLIRGEIATFRIEKRYLRKDGNPIWVRINTVMKWDDDGEPLHNISIVEDISESKSAEARIEHLATHDELTGLPNRSLFTQTFAARLAETGNREGDSCAVLFIDLDRFKAINDTLGHQTGDAVLEAVAQRVRAGIRSSDIVARFGGDEFVVMLNHLTDGRQATDIATQILHGLRMPLTVLGREFRISASIGVAVFPEDGTDASALLKHADMAMYAAKEYGRNEVQRFNPEIGTTSVRQITLGTYLAQGLEREEFLLQYQPRIDALTGVIVGAEALMRWWNRELGTIPPVQFIPIAEESGLIIPIGRWAIERACEQAVRWQARTDRDPSVSVNLSPRQFRDADLIRHIRDTLDTTGLPPGKLELEITESAVMADLRESVRIAGSIRELGVRLALDDFGTGHSSLAQLRRFPLDVLKIDRSFVRDIATSEEDRAITTAIVSMARQLGIEVVAEGVETAEQSALLAELGCDQLQGFYFGAPSHPDEIARMLRSSGI